ncbi:activator of basal transcription 1-like [Lineus longissimus]|uniref:activator of basal transcription 1-like n=1 Tax=Lineus longissimus TaxID=88925 RepID=UPI002B4E355E
MASDDEKRDIIVQKKRKKAPKLENIEAEAGIVYLSRIPTYMGVNHMRHIMSQYGEVGKIFLQPADKQKPGNKRRQFSEGWVEFLDKKKAKRVAASLNNQQVGGKKRNAWYWDLWNIKYLPKFKWGHLHERLAYERAVHSQRMRTEISQVKRESNYHIQSVEIAERIKKNKKKLKGEGGTDVMREWEYTQKQTEDEILSKKRKLTSEDTDNSGMKKKVKPDSKKPRSDFLKGLFSGGVLEEEV